MFKTVQKNNTDSIEDFSGTWQELIDQKAAICDISFLQINTATSEIIGMPAKRVWSILVQRWSPNYWTALAIPYTAIETAKCYRAAKFGSENYVGWIEV